MQCLVFSTAVAQIADDCCSPLATGKLQQVCVCVCVFPSQGSDDESYVSDVSDNISEDNASVTDNVSRQSRSISRTIVNLSQASLFPFF